MMKPNDCVKIIELMASKICHDLISPIGAINNGLTKDEIAEVFLQAMIYCGVPAAIDSFRNAREVFKEMGI